MKPFKTLIYAILLTCTFSCYGQDNSFHYEMNKKENIINITYTDLSSLLKLDEMEKVIEILKIKPELASSLTLKQVEKIGWKNWVILNTDFVQNKQPDRVEPEINNWIESFERNIISDLLKEKLEIALISELERDWYDWNDSKNKLSLKEKKQFKNKVETKIKYLNNQKNKESIIRLFKNAAMEINIIKK